MDMAFVRYLAARWFHKHAGRLAKQMDGVCKAEDIECVHRARVASRRLRAGLRLFADWGPPKQQARWRKHIRRIGQKLGEARDLDVQLVFLCSRQPETDSLSVRLGLVHLILHWEHRREALQKKVVRAVRRLRQSGVLNEIRKRSAQILQDQDFSEEAIPQTPLWKEAARQVQEYVEELFQHAPCLEDPEDQQRHHAMRIAGKRLRYTLEMLEPLLGPEVRPILQSLQTFQTLLGEVHDCDVWLEQLDGLEKVVLRAQDAGRGRKRSKSKKVSKRVAEQVRTAIRWLQQERAESRQRFFQEAVVHWRRSLQVEVGERLEGLIQKACLQPIQAEAPPPRHLPPHGAKQKEVALLGAGTQEASLPEREKRWDRPSKSRAVHW